MKAKNILFAILVLSTGFFLLGCGSSENGSSSKDDNLVSDNVIEETTEEPVSVVDETDNQGETVQASSVIHLDQSEISVSENAETTVSAMIDNITELYGYQFDVEFDPDLVEVVKVDEGTFLKGDGTDSTFFIPPPGSAGKERITIACSRVGAVSGVDGAGTLAQITFRGKGPGKANVKVVRGSEVLINSNNSRITLN